ncbi:F-box domain-containing protein [Favolaschia claudopus]|uniref:F-box domain-containing protein n=1 Tax=Favolaschia claudopus TaxID=2862362 RepID=A0AAW0B8D9_9AGAR
MSPTSPVADLHIQIDKLSEKIEIQKQVLRHLEEQRSQARIQLNSFTDPMARLPLEIQSHIFLCVEPKARHHSTQVDLGDFPLAFLNVCHFWRVIALSTPRLWTTISMMTVPRTANHTKVCKAWLGRARTLPLSISLDSEGCFGLDSGVQDLITQYGQQLRKLTLQLPVGSLFNGLDSALPFRLEGPFLALRDLTIRSNRFNKLDSVNRCKLMELLRVCPAVSHCCMSNLVCEEEAGHLDLSPLTLPSLETLHLGNPFSFAFDRMGGNSAFILPYLCAPALKDLSLTALNIPDQALVSFFARSASPLESFTLSLEYVWTESFVDQCLRLIPTLTALKLFAVSDSELDDRFLPFFEVLSASHNHLPLLRQLTLRTDCSSFINYERLLHMLTTRRTSLESFELKLLWSDDDYHEYDLPLDFEAKPDADVLAALRQLVKGGMSIHVGSTTRNLL